MKKVILLIIIGIFVFTGGVEAQKSNTAQKGKSDNEIIANMAKKFSLTEDQTLQVQKIYGELRAERSKVHRANPNNKAALEQVNAKTKTQFLEKLKTILTAEWLDSKPKKH